MKTTFRKLDALSREAANAFITATMNATRQPFPFDPDGELTIELKINGEEVDFATIIEAAALDLKDRVHRLAADLASQRAWNGFHDLANVIEKAKEELESKTRELFPDAYPDED